MSRIGTVDSLWRFPVKSMAGEELAESFVGFSGIYGDRIFAFKDAAAPKFFPYFTAREQRQMLRYRPQFRNPEATVQPINWTDADAFGTTPLYADLADLMVDVETPSGEAFAIDDPALIAHLLQGLPDKYDLSLIRSERALTDCRPVSLFSQQTVQQIGEESGFPVDYRCFRANIYLNLDSGLGFEEDTLVGSTLRIGSQVQVVILKRDGRCQMITIDPDTGTSNPAILRQVAQNHEAKAGVYGAVLVEGTVRKGDLVEVVSA